MRCSAFILTLMPPSDTWRIFNLLLLQSPAGGTWSTEGRGEAGTVPEEEEASPGSGGMDQISVLKPELALGSHGELLSRTVAGTS